MADEVRATEAELSDLPETLRSLGAFYSTRTSQGYWTVIERGRITLSLHAFAWQWRRRIDRFTVTLCVDREGHRAWYVDQMYIGQDAGAAREAFLGVATMMAGVPLDAARSDEVDVAQVAARVPMSLALAVGLSEAARGGAVLRIHLLHKNLRALPHRTGVLVAVSGLAAGVCEDALRATTEVVERTAPGVWMALFEGAP